MLLCGFLRAPFAQQTAGAAGTRPSLRPLGLECGEIKQSSGEAAARTGRHVCEPTRAFENGGDAALALSLRAQRSNPEFVPGDSVDCFVAEAPRNDEAERACARLHLLAPDAPQRPREDTLLGRDEAARLNFLSEWGIVIPYTYLESKRMTMNATIESTPGPDTLSQRLTVVLAAACGMVAANIYYAQPLIAPISAALGLSHAAAGLIVTMTQIGYGTGLLLIVPLGDLVENRALICAVIMLGAAALLAAAFATHALPFLLAALFIGVGSVAVQIIIPYAAHLAPEAIRGRVVGNVSTGLMLGIMLARPVSSFITAALSWHAVFFCSAALMIVLAAVLWMTLPKRRPLARMHYGELLLSMPQLVRATPLLRRRALYQASLFGAFTLFWTVAPLQLAGEFGFTQRGIALFALAGVAGVFAAPIAGRLADSGHSRIATLVAMLLAAAGFLATYIGVPGSMLNLACLVVAAIAIDIGVQGNVVLGFRAIFALGHEHRSRLNGLYMATFFAAGAAGSGVGAFAFAQGGWMLASAIGLALPVAGLLYAATE
jgi:predicted MFS family arabinose efflux permease